MIANICLVLTLAAFVMGTIDSLLIDMQKKIVHGLRGAIRFILGGGLAVAIVVQWGMGYGRVAAMMLGGAAAFSIVFRLSLNMMRLKAPTYLGMGALYDRMWLNIGKGLLKNPAYGGWLVYIAEGITALVVATVYTLF